MCSHANTVMTDYSIICTTCGLERPVVISNVDYHQSMCSAPLTRLYNRGDRWTCITKKVMGVHSGPSNTDPIWKHLEKHKDSLHTTADVMNCISKSNVKNKHYPCLHVFCRMFLKNYTRPNPQPHIVLEKMESYFKHILNLWSAAKLPDDQFFNYNWLLEQGLSLHGFTEYIPYVKRLKCITRRDRYVQLLLRLYETRAGMRSHEQSDTRSHCEKCPASNHRSQSPMRPRLGQQTVESRRALFPEDSQLARLYRCAVTRGSPGMS